MSEGAAGRRVTAVRVCRRFPDAFGRVARGELHLCALCALASHLNAENAAELFAACKGKTRRQIEELLAVRFPRPDVREQIRRLPVRVQVPVDAAKPMATATQTLPPTRPAAERRTPPGEVSRSSAATGSATGEVRAAQVRKLGRYLSVVVRREIHARDHGRCSFVSADGRRRTARTFLEFDHVKPFARFGTADPRNLRLLCRAHNLLHARNCFGVMHLAAKIAAKRRIAPAASAVP